MSMKKQAELIRSAETLEEATSILEALLGKSGNKPPTYDEVIEFAKDRAEKDGEDEGWYVSQAHNAYEYYQGNMEVLGCRVWKDGNGTTVKNWKLRIINNWLRNK